MGSGHLVRHLGQLHRSREQTLRRCRHLRHFGSKTEHHKAHRSRRMSTKSTTTSTTTVTTTTTMSVRITTGTGTMMRPMSSLCLSQQIGTAYVGDIWRSMLLCLQCRLTWTGLSRRSPGAEQIIPGSCQGQGLMLWYWTRLWLGQTKVSSFPGASSMMGAA